MSYSHKRTSRKGSKDSLMSNKPSSGTSKLSDLLTGLDEMRNADSSEATNDKTAPNSAATERNAFTTPPISPQIPKRMGSEDKKKMTNAMSKLDSLMNFSMEADMSKVNVQHDADTLKSPLDMQKLKERQDIEYIAPPSRKTSRASHRSNTAVSPKSDTVSMKESPISPVGLPSLPELLEETASYRINEKYSSKKRKVETLKGYLNNLKNRLSIESKIRNSAVKLIKSNPDAAEAQLSQATRTLDSIHDDIQVTLVSIQDNQSAVYEHIIAVMRARIVDLESAALSLPTPNSAMTSSSSGSKNSQMDHETMEELQMLRSENSSLERENTMLKEQRHKLEATIEKKNEEFSLMEQELEMLKTVNMNQEAAIEEYTMNAEANASLETDLIATANELEAAKDKILEFERQDAELRKEFKNIRTLYDELSLENEALQEELEFMHSNQRGVSTADVEKIRGELEELQEMFRKTREEKDELVARHQEEMEALQNSKGDDQMVKNKYESEIVALQEKCTALEDELARTRLELESKQSTVADGHTNAKLLGELELFQSENNILRKQIEELGMKLADSKNRHSLSQRMSGTVTPVEEMEGPDFALIEEIGRLQERIIAITQENNELKESLAMQDESVEKLITDREILMGELSRMAHGMSELKEHNFTATETIEELREAVEGLKAQLASVKLNGLGGDNSDATTAQLKQECERMLQEAKEQYMKDLQKEQKQRRDLQRKYEQATKLQVKSHEENKGIQTNLRWLSGDKPTSSFW